ncbi:MAG: L-aspartate oxidase [Bdellovibrionaceae bacterium]|nr:L-aspartate oxidase [Pseudobdellovibrionaceae bacterium]|tara:strand:+ start:4189 stop:5790 length:1602 start_codon:yes stop_codon:yes gene_type:complete
MVSSSVESVKFLVLGSGIGGLSLALKLADQGPVSIFTKGKIDEGASRYAQGGIASVWSKKDCFEDHVQDTLVAGAGLCQIDRVQLCVEEGPRRIEELIKWGVEFTRRKDVSVDPTEVFDLHREGGHGKRRILHADDATGRAVMDALIQQVKTHPKIEIFEFHVAIDLILSSDQRTCIGAYLLDEKKGYVKTVLGVSTFLATGGAGKTYLYTSNPDTATGDGIAMAYRAGARVSNLEFFQFHPTCLFHPEAKNFLISEAIRGEGAELVDQSGRAFMKDYDARGSLAPRDIVARAIDFEMKKSGNSSVYLDTTCFSEEKFKDKFPMILKKCESLGLDPSREPLAVVPAAHYCCGGVWVDEWGQTTVKQLYAVGEVASTGVHGANRLASNSLLEAIVFADRISKKMNTENKDPLHSHSVVQSFQWDVGQATPLEEKIDIAAAWLELRTLMWNYVGIVRSDRRLEKAHRRIQMIKEEVRQAYWENLLTRDLIELRNLCHVSDLIVKSAMSRKESRGLHFNVNWKSKDDLLFLKDTIL